VVGLATKPAFARFLRQTKTGKLRIDRSAVNHERKLDGKYLLRTSDESLSAEDIALGYKALYEAERGWRDLKSTIDLRPVYHRREGPHRVPRPAVLAGAAAAARRRDRGRRHLAQHPQRA